MFKRDNSLGLSGEWLKKCLTGEEEKKSKKECSTDMESERNLGNLVGGDEVDKQILTGRPE